jgi:hypothetical protein
MYKTEHQESADEPQVIRLTLEIKHQGSADEPQVIRLALEVKDESLSKFRRDVMVKRDFC